MLNEADDFDMEDDEQGCMGNGVSFNNIYAYKQCCSGHARIKGSFYGGTIYYECYDGNPTCWNNGHTFTNSKEFTKCCTKRAKVTDYKKYECAHVWLTLLISSSNYIFTFFKHLIVYPNSSTTLLYPQRRIITDTAVYFVYLSISHMQSSFWAKRSLAQNKIDELYIQV